MGPYSKRHVVMMAFMLILPLLPVSAGNLLVNPGMEEGDSIISPWQIYTFTPEASDFFIEKGNAKGGEHYLTIVNRGDNDARLIQRIAVEQHASYRISGWIKTEGVAESNIGANLSLNDYWFISQDVKGTTADWKYVEFYFTVEDDIAAVEVALRLGGYGAITTGKASFDDAAMEKVATIPPGSIHYVIEKKEAQDRQQVNTGGVNTGDQRGGGGWKIMPETLQFIAVAVIILAGIAVFTVFLLVYKPEKEKSGKSEAGSGKAAD
ncbi:MAG: carbohydrate binding domain-containing protein [Spirochaetales bacterium]|nr:carbohydrate binding domain-containing protein [Spirochaetales bacterium]